MRGRYPRTVELGDIFTYFGIRGEEIDYKPRYNIAPLSVS